MEIFCVWKKRKEKVRVTFLSPAVGEEHDNNKQKTKRKTKNPNHQAATLTLVKDDVYKRWIVECLTFIIVYYCCCFFFLIRRPSSFHIFFYFLAGCLK